MDARLQGEAGNARTRFFFSVYYRMHAYVFIEKNNNNNSVSWNETIAGRQKYVKRTKEG